MQINLNRLVIPSDTQYEGGGPLRDYSTTSNGVSVYFRNLEEHLIHHIQEADVVFGCVAWLTSDPILKALEQKQTAIVVQKEDFLRPDLNARSGWPKWLQGRYKSLKCNLERRSFPGLMGQLSVGTYAAYDSQDPIRCVGNYNSDKSPAFPRAHHKFVIFGRTKAKPRQPSEAIFPSDYSTTEIQSLGFGVGDENFVFNGTDIEDLDDEEDDFDSSEGLTVQPYGVWTGSFNFTKNAGHSLENAVYLEDKAIVNAYANEFAQIFALSEPLNWESVWSCPEFRVGT